MALGAAGARPTRHNAGTSQFWRILLVVLVVCLVFPSGALTERVAVRASSHSRARSVSALETATAVSPPYRRSRGADAPTSALAGRVVPARPAPSVTEALRLASITYGVPYREMRSVAWCESRLDPRAYNRSSGASGLMQFLPSTWRRTPYASLSPFSPHANALAGGWLYVRSGRSWRQWVCRP